jgi:hypothetical protein
MATAPRLLRVTVAAVLTGTAAVAAWVLVSRMSGGAIAPPPLARIPLLASTDWKRRVLDATIKAESGGSYSKVNANTDGAGLSFGLIQWAQKPGSLGTLLAAMYARDTTRFANTFGPNWQALMAATKAGGTAPVGGVYLWQEPWLSRFKAAGNDPVFQQVQDDVIYSGSYMRDAIAAARTLGGTPTERGMALLFDVAVNQGGYVKTLAAQAVAANPGGDFNSRLRTFATLAPARFEASAPQSSGGWRQTASGVWHKFAGSVDLHISVSSRVVKILSHPLLTDQQVTV